MGLPARSVGFEATDRDLSDLYFLINSLLESPTEARPGKSKSDSPVREALCSTKGGFIELEELSPGANSLLHNELPGYGEFPLSLQDGLFFSEVISADFPGVELYRDWVQLSLAVISESLGNRRAISHSTIDMLGKKIQCIDARFAKTRIDAPLDRIHTFSGPDREHSYRKITLCRTTFPVEIRGEIIPFFYEKFLVVYSYLDENGRRCCTITPLHSHPYNHEVVYFARWGKKSKAIESEYEPCDEASAPLLSAEGAPNRNLIDRRGKLEVEKLRLRYLQRSEILPQPEPIILEPFRSELALRNPNLSFQVDGLFRPHKVEVIQDDSAPEGTCYYAINNYWGPLGRVFVFSDQGKVQLWSHARWAKRSGLTPQIEKIREPGAPLRPREAPLLGGARVPH